MRILLVSHRFPPQHTAGTESYTFELGRELVDRGHAVRVLCADKNVSRPDLTAQTREYEGLIVDEVTNNLHYDAFRQTYDLPKVARFAAELCERERIDVVHVQHAMHLSAGLVESIAQGGRPVFFTLHDYWLSCPRMGQRVHVDGTLCHVIDHARCGDCMSRTKWGQSPMEQRVARSLAALRGASGLDLATVAQSSANVLRRGPIVRRGPAVERERAQQMEAAIDARRGWLAAHVVPHVRRFFAPSRFLRGRMVEWGLPEERTEYLPIGLSTSFRRVARAPGPRLRVGFLGTVTPLKAPHVLLDAWARLEPELRDRAELVVYGPLRHEPDYVRSLARRAREVGATLAGHVPRAEVPAVLAGLDLLVVPSVWYENSPMAILEAQSCGTPLIVSDLGGMAELVRGDPAGWTFQPGDAADLARVLGERLADPEALRSAAERVVELPTLAAHVERLEEHYRAAHPAGPS